MPYSQASSQVQTCLLIISQPLYVTSIQLCMQEIGSKANQPKTNRILQPCKITEFRGTKKGPDQKYFIKTLIHYHKIRQIVYLYKSTTANSKTILRRAMGSGFHIFLQTITVLNRKYRQDAGRTTRSMAGSKVTLTKNQQKMANTIITSW